VTRWRAWASLLVTKRRAEALSPSLREPEPEGARAWEPPSNRSGLARESLSGGPEGAGAPLGADDTAAGAAAAGRRGASDRGLGVDREGVPGVARTLSPGRAAQV
jgi:hypothetical protein